MSRMTRRGFAAAGAALLIPATPIRAAGGYPSVLAFAAYRNGKRIGEQRMTFDANGGALTVRTEAQLSVKIGPVTAFRYVHEAVERWNGDRFERLDTRTSAGGRKESVTAVRSPAGVRVSGSGIAAFVARADALPFTHWNVGILKAPLFNPQTGKLLRHAVRIVGPSSVVTADGRKQEARRVVFTGDAMIDNWYDAADIWTGLRGRLDDGSMLEYRRL